MFDIFIQPNIGVAIIVGLASTIAIIIQFVPKVHFLSYPIRLFITVIHELCHGIAAMTTGGEFTHFVVRLDTSGTAWRYGGWDFVVTPAGYLGTTMFSALLILSTGIDGAAQMVLSSLGVFVIILVLIFGWKSLTTLLIGLGYGLGAVFIAWYANENWALFSISLLAVFGCLDALSDLRWMALAARLGIPRSNDATKMAIRFGCSTVFWTWAWTIIALLMVGWAMWFAWFRG